MCVKFVHSKTEIKYDSSVPLENQLKDCKEVLINYESSDPDINKFVKEVERLCKTGTSANISVKVLHNDNIKGIKTKKHLNKLVKDLDINEAVKLLVNMQSKLETALEEFSNHCKKL